MIERIAHKARGFAEADRRDLEQHRCLTPAERQIAAAWLKEKHFGIDCPDVRITRTVKVVRRK
jgi:hypothetical protein